MDERDNPQATNEEPIADAGPEQASLDAQASDDAAAVGTLFKEADDNSENYIDPTTGQVNDQGFAREGQGAPDPSLKHDLGKDEAAPPPLDGE